MIRRLLLIALLCAGCPFYRVPAYAYQTVPADEVEELESAVAEDLRCPDDQVESRQLTLLTWQVRGCGHQRVYAWDAMREEWVLTAVERH